MFHQAAKIIRHGPSTAHRVLGVRVWALIEAGTLITALLILDWLVLDGDRFRQVSPHPFWGVILVLAVQYGTAEGLAAAALSCLALLAGNIPEQGLQEDFHGWITRITLEPMMWLTTAVAIGELQMARQRERDRLADELAAATGREAAIADAYEKLSRVKESLEHRVAAQAQTVVGTYTASRAIERPDVGEVLLGIGELVRTVIAPDTFSVFLLDQDPDRGPHPHPHRLAAVLSEGWTRDGHARQFDPSSPLFQAVVRDRRRLCITVPEDAAILAGEGVLAGPLVSADRGRTIGMLKIETMGFLGLNPTTVLNFDVLCQWIGAAYDSARRTGSA